MSEKLPHGDLFVISAPSGAGKTTLCRRLLSGLEGIDFSISDTTRSPRAGERDGVDYHFVDREVFDRRRKAGEFLEWAVVGGEVYGTSAESVRQARARGRDVLLDIDTQGAESVRRSVPEAILIFILPPSREALRGQLEGRGTETPEGLTIYEIGTDYVLGRTTDELEVERVVLLSLERRAP